MIITLKKAIPKEEMKKIIGGIEAKGLQVTMIEGTDYTVFGVVGDTTRVDSKNIEANPWVDHVNRIAAPYKLANRLFHPNDSIIEVGGIKIGGNEPVVIIGGPCSVESREGIFEIADAVKQSGGVMFRGGAYKPRTSPYVFQGMGTEGVKWMTELRTEFKMPIVSELMGIEKIEEFEEHVDLIQVGARNMQNFDLLKLLGKIKKPILLKRGLANTIEEWIMAAEYIMAGGNENVILCERGIRTFETYTRNTLDLSVIPIIKQKTHLPIIIDPSHGTGHWSLVESMSLAAIAAGADGLMIEVHNNPECAFSDGAQSLKPEKFQVLVEKGRGIAKVIGRGL